MVGEAGHAWIPEYGDPLNATDFSYMMKWSPLHNVRIPQLGTRQYPAMLLSTGAAKLPSPILLRVMEMMKRL